MQKDINRVENAMRLIIGRKNYLFAKSHQAAQRAAMVYSLIVACCINHINPYTWLKEELEVMHQYTINNIAYLLLKLEKPKA